MKKCILSAIAGALAMLTTLMIIATFRTNQMEENPVYKNVTYVSELGKNACAFCGDGKDALFSQQKGDNVAILDLNSFEIIDIPMNNSFENGQLISEEEGLYKGYVQFGEDTYVHTKTFSYCGYSNVEIHSAKYGIDTDFLTTHLCQTCLDLVNVFYWSEETPPAYAIVSFSERIVKPLDRSLEWFLIEKYGIDCEYKDNATIHLRIFYCPPRYT